MLTYITFYKEFIPRYAKVGHVDPKTTKTVGKGNNDNHKIKNIHVDE